MRQADVAVLGAGPAGLAAAIEAARAGARVLLLDESGRVGGRIYGHLAGGEDHTAGRLATKGRQLLAEFRSLDIAFLPDAVVWGIFDGRTIELHTPGGPARVQGQSVVLAPGALERWIPFPGWTLPGVLGAGGLQRLVRDHGIIPGNRVIVAGTGPLLLSMAAELLRHRIQVAAVLEASPFGRLAALLPRIARACPGLLADIVRWWGCLARAGVRMKFQHALIEARGDRRVEQALVARLDAAGSPIPGGREQILADTIVLNFGFVPSVTLAALAGCRVEMSRSNATPVVWRDGDLQSSMAGVFVCGDAAGVHGALVAEAEGRLVGITAAAHAGHGVRSVAEERRRRIQRTLARVSRLGEAVATAYTLPPGLYDLITPETEVCRCEEVTAREVLDAIDAGAMSLKALKGLTDCGMGPCQGQVCGAIVAGMLIRRGGDGRHGVFAPRPPARPIPLGGLIGAG